MKRLVSVIGQGIGTPKQYQVLAIIPPPPAHADLNDMEDAMDAVQHDLFELISWVYPLQIESRIFEFRFVKLPILLK